MDENLPVVDRPALVGVSVVAMPHLHRAAIDLPILQVHAHLASLEGLGEDDLQGSVLLPLHGRFGEAWGDEQLAAVVKRLRVRPIWA